MDQDVPGLGHVSDPNIKPLSRVGKREHAIETTITNPERNPEGERGPEVGNVIFQTGNDRGMECNDWAMPGTRWAASLNLEILLLCRTSSEIPSGRGVPLRKHCRVGREIPTRLGLAYLALGQISRAVGRSTGRQFGRWGASALWFYLSSCTNQMYILAAADGGPGSRSCPKSTYPLQGPTRLPTTYVLPTGTAGKLRTE